jgi:hypothetical protein
LGRQATRRQLGELRQEAGELAFRQRDFKGGLKTASRAAEPLAEAEMMMADSDAAGLARGAGGGLGGSPVDSLGVNESLRSLRRSSPRAAAASSGLRTNSSPVAGSSARGRSVAGPRVKRIGSKTFFLRGNRYVDADATKKQIDNATKIEQFSDEYFELLEELGDEVKAYLAEETELLVILNKKAYLITAAKKE